MLAPCREGAGPERQRGTCTTLAHQCAAGRVLAHLCASTRPEQGSGYLEGRERATCSPALVALVLAHPTVRCLRPTVRWLFPTAFGVVATPTELPSGLQKVGSAWVSDPPTFGSVATTPKASGASLINLQSQGIKYKMPEGRSAGYLGPPLFGIL